MKQYYGAIQTALAAIVVILSVRAYFQEREDLIRMQAELSATHQIIQLRDTQIKDLNSQIEARNKKTQVLVNEIEALKARPLPIKEIIREIPTYVPLDTPPTLTPPVGPESAKMVFDEKQSNELREFYLDCQAKTLQLKACTENEEDWRKKELTWAEKEKILIQQREAAIRAAKGGSFWTRFKRGAKTFGVGVAVGVGVGIAASR